MIQMSVSKNDGIQLVRYDCLRNVIKMLGSGRALEHSTIYKNAGSIGSYEIAGAGNILCGSEKCDFHLFTP